MYRYAQVETALMRLNEVSETGRGALRGRLKNLQRLGVSPAAPGKGSRIEYSFEDVMLLALCLEFAQFGIDPTRVAQVKEYVWPHIKDRITASEIEDDMILAAQPNVMTGSIQYERSLLKENDLGTFRIFGIEHNMRRWIYKLSEIPSLIEERAIVIHLTNLHRELRKKLDSADREG